MKIQQRPLPSFFLVYSTLYIQKNQVFLTYLFVIVVFLLWLLMVMNMINSNFIVIVIIIKDFIIWVVIINMVAMVIYEAGVKV